MLFLAGRSLGAREELNLCFLRISYLECPRRSSLFAGSSWPPAEPHVYSGREGRGGDQCRRFPGYGFYSRDSYAQSQLEQALRWLPLGELAVWHRAFCRSAEVQRYSLGRGPF